jgi:hypothetical protein
MKHILINWKTSLAGVVILACLILLAIGRINTEQFLGILGGVTAAGLLASKDAAKAGIIVLALLLASCVTYDRCAKKYGTPGKATQTVKTVEGVAAAKAPVPPDSAELTVNPDSLARQTAPAELKSASPSGRAEITVSRDKKTGSIKVKGNCKADTVRVNVPYRVEVPCICPPQTILAKPPSRLQMLLASYREAAGWLLPLLALLLIFLFKVKTR